MRHTNNARRSRRESSRSKRVRRGATQSGNAPLSLRRLTGYFRAHPRSLRFSLARLTRAPLSSLMTIGVIGIALSLPASLHVLLKNVLGAVENLDTNPGISLYLTPGLAEEDRHALQERLSRRADIASIELVTAEQGLRQFREVSGMGEVLDALEDNPLPDTLILTPTDQDDLSSLERIAGELEALPQIELVQLDLAWLKRLHAILDVGKRLVLAIAMVLALAVLLIVGNTVRLDIEGRKDEIVVAKLIGATNGFVRRPFLYSGLLYGLLGGLTACLTVEIAIGFMRGPVARLSSLYQNAYELSGLRPVDTLVVLGTSVALGLAGSWFAVGRHLGRIEPS
ncbi:MAG: permease-like cell division protein FtsX [Gammaproteobacteria bacterium]|nr:permease-like cell division protein FtsX [Gammaproteobacteria bacterium]